MRTPARLWHYTCSHSADGIRADRELRPHPQVWLPEPLVWLTDLDDAWREALGLTSHTLRCDRTEHRFQVLDTAGVVWWPTYARTIRLAGAVRQGYDQAPGAQPVHWWVSTEPVPVRPAQPAHQPTGDHP